MLFVLRSGTKETSACSWLSQSLSPAGKPIEFDRSIGIRLANEAAEMGKIMRRSEKEVVSNFNFKDRWRAFEDKFDVDEAFDEKGRKIFRTGLLLDQYIKEYKRTKEETNYGLEMIVSISIQNKRML